MGSNDFKDVFHRTSTGLTSNILKIGSWNHIWHTGNIIIKHICFPTSKISIKNANFCVNGNPVQLEMTSFKKDLWEAVCFHLVCYGSSTVSTIGPLYVTSSHLTRIFYRGVSGSVFHKHRRPEISPATGLSVSGYIFVNLKKIRPLKICAD